MNRSLSFSCPYLTVLFLLFACSSTWNTALGWGPNAGGTIILHDPGVAYSTDRDDYCGLGAAPASCAAADVRLDGTDPAQPKVFKMYAAFPDGSRPRLKAMTFGIHYSPGIVLTACGPCTGDLNNGAYEFPGPGWPGSDTGTAIVFRYTQTTQLVECYWFAGYNYDAPQPQAFQLRDHPDPILGGYFCDDGVIDELDPIAGYGSLGFDADGQVACPQVVAGACCHENNGCVITLEEHCYGIRWLPLVDCDPNPCIAPTGACCNLQTGECLLLSEQECTEQPYPHEYMGDGTVCEPESPCPDPVPVESCTWGGIKRLYR